MMFHLVETSEEVKIPRTMKSKGLRGIRQVKSNRLHFKSNIVAGSSHCYEKKIKTKPK